MHKKLITCLDDLRKLTNFKPEIGIALGSGLGDFAENIQAVQRIRYTDIEGFPAATVSGNKGQFVLGYIGEKPVIVMWRESLEMRSVTKK